MDTFHLKWDNEKCKVLAIIDSYTHFETNAVIHSESMEEEIEVLNKQWISWAGTPKIIRTDSSGAHMSEFFQAWCDDRQIRLELVPKEAHHQLGMVERLHAVRRQQLIKMKAEKSDLKLEQAVLHACEQRNRLRTVHGASPAAMVFGLTPGQAGISDDPHGVRPDGAAKHMEDMAVRTMAAKAFYESNNSAKIRRALLAKSRKEHEALQVGDFAFYWRTGNDKLEPSRWRGPALICAIEPRPAGDGSQRPAVYWLAHGSSLVRAAPEHVRLEVPRERAERLATQPETAARTPLQQQLVNALRPVRGPIRFLELGPGEPPSDARGDGLLASTGEVGGPGDGGFFPPVLPPSQSEDAPSVPKKVEKKRRKDNETKHEGRVQENEVKKEALRQETQAQLQEIKKSAADPSDEPQQGHQEPTAMEEPNAEKRGRPRSPPPIDEIRRSYNAARLLDGLPAKHDIDEATLRRAGKWQVEKQAGDMEVDDELLAEEFNEKFLTVDERKQFDEAKDKALMVWIENAAWKAVDEQEAGQGEVVPARFLQRWKKTADGLKANARVIIQGFKHRDVLEQQLETESPTLTRTGRMLIYALTVHRRWKLFSADVKSAFMQADSIDDKTRIFVKPNSDMRRRLERLMGLLPHQILKATKPAFGDVRAPRQWYDTADGVVVGDLKFYRHALDRCVFMSAREATAEDDPFLIFQDKGKSMVVDGVLGLHVDDFIGSGEGIFSIDNLEGDYDGAFQCFRDRLCGLSRRFRFGSWSFGPTMDFCGAEVEQSLDFETIQISMAEYVKKVKPISIDKSRKTMSGSPCTTVEQKQLRAIVGAMAWPANQCLPQISATCSLLQASVANPTVLDLCEANKGLRFLKDVAKDYKMQIHRHGDLADLRFGVYADAAWAVRPDSTSQGGFLIFLASKQELNNGEAMKLSIIDWASRKLARICRSSLSAESQSASAAIDQLEWIRICWSIMLWPTTRYEDENVLVHTGDSPALTDAKALYDAVNSLTQSKVADRRTAIEVSIIQDRLKAMKSMMKWVNSGQQLADGLTKKQAREQFAYLLQRGIHRLIYDGDFVADKKIAKEKKEMQRAEMEELAKDMFDGQVLMTEEVESNSKKCALVGCEKPIDENNPKNKFCSRRHYYLDHHRKFGHSDQWKRAALQAISVIAVSEMIGAEAAKFEKGNEESDLFFNTFLVIGIFAIVGFFGVVMKIKEAFEFAKTIFQRNDAVTRNAAVTEYARVPDETYANRRHGREAQNVIARANAGVGEYEAVPERCDVSVGSSEDDHTPKSVQTSPTQDEVACVHSDVIWRGTNGTHWKWTCKLCGKVEVISKSDQPERPVPSSSSSHQRPFSLSAEKRQHVKNLEEHKIADKIIQTPLTFDRRANPSKFQLLKQHEHGARGHVSFFEDRIWVIRL